MSRVGLVQGVGPRTRGEAPSRVRHGVVMLAVVLAGITYVDRVCIAQAAPHIQKDLGLTSVELGMAFSAFALAYALFEIPGGWLGDRIGPRKVLMRIVVAWSTFTAATGYPGTQSRWWFCVFCLAQGRQVVFRISPGPS